jgi:hypothetical protein
LLTCVEAECEPLARENAAAKLFVKTIFQGLVSKSLTVELTTPDNGGHPQGDFKQRRIGCCSHLVA